jgi:uncharacterized protein YmfQ (DUF2313 family)
VISGIEHFVAREEELAEINRNLDAEGHQRLSQIVETMNQVRQEVCPEARVAALVELLNLCGLDSICMVPKSTKTFAQNYPGGMLGIRPA